MNRYISLALTVLVFYFLYRNFNAIHWNEVLATLRTLPASTILCALCLTVIDYAILGTYELLSVRRIGSRAPAAKVYAIAQICYSFTMSLGALIGGLGMRYKFYRRWDLSPQTIWNIILFSTATNWLGLILLSAILCLGLAHEVATALNSSETFIYILGLTGLLAVAAYFFLCWRKSSLRFRRLRFDFPTPGLGTFQVFLAVFQWTILGNLLNLFLQLSYVKVLPVLLSASVLGVFVHVPAGLGVLEAVFLWANLPATDTKIVAGLFAYRIIYYLVPLVVGVINYVTSFKTKHV